MNEKNRNHFITKLLGLKSILSDKKKYFTVNLDGNNKVSKLSNLITQLNDSEIIDSKQKEELIEKLKEDSQESQKTMDLIVDMISSKLKDLGYNEQQTTNPKKEQEPDENKNIIEEYERIITSIENMINELDKTMNEVDKWINKISTLIIHDVKKDIEQENSAEVSVDIDNDNFLNLK